MKYANFRVKEITFPSGTSEPQCYISNGGSMYVDAEGCIVMYTPYLYANRDVAEEALKRFRPPPSPRYL